MSIEERLAGLSPQQREQLAQMLEARKDVTELVAGRVQPDRKLGLTPGQQRIWAVQDRHPGLPVDVVCQVVRIPGGDPTVVLQKLTAFCDRHPVFRLAFDRDDREVYQQVRSIPRVELSIGAPLTSRQEACDRAVALARETTDPVGGVLMRARVCPGPSEVWCLVSVHNLVFDAWSFQLLLEGLAGEEPPSAASFQDFADWQCAWASSDPGAEATEYWQKTMREAPAPLPCDFARETDASHEGARYVVNLSQDVTAAFARLAMQESCSVFAVWAAVIQELAAEHGGSDDVVIGMFTSNREQPASQGIVGYLLNVIPLRVRAAGTFRERVHAAWASVRGSQRYGSYPGELIADQWGRVSEHAHRLFEWVLVYEDITASESVGEWSTYDVVDVPKGIARYELTITVNPLADGVEVGLEYDTSRYRKETVAGLGQRLQQICERACADPELTLEPGGN